MQIKICGLMRSEQLQGVLALEPNYVGFICVPRSPRYLTPQQLGDLWRSRPPDSGKTQGVGVFADADLETIAATLAQAPLGGIQLHGGESVAFCRQVKQRWPDVQVIKALRIRGEEDLAQAVAYGEGVDALLLDAYHPQQLGGTGVTLDWEALGTWRSPVPWFLAGGLTPDNVAEALGQVQPDGVDVSSGVERSPGNKDLHRVAAFIQAVRSQSLVL